jgi:hypothetical protein
MPKKKEDEKDKKKKTKEQSRISLNTGTTPSNRRVVRCEK